MSSWAGLLLCFIGFLKSLLNSIVLVLTLASHGDQVSLELVLMKACDLRSSAIGHTPRLPKSILVLGDHAVAGDVPFYLHVRKQAKCTPFTPSGSNAKDIFCLSLSFSCLAS